MKNDTRVTAIDAKERRKERSRALEQEVFRAFRDYAKPMDDRGIAGLEILGGKVVADLEDQLEHVVGLRKAGRHVDQEVSRLLRMLEKRKGMLDQLRDALAIDEDLARRAEAVLARNLANHPS